MGSANTPPVSTIRVTAPDLFGGLCSSYPPNRHATPRVERGKRAPVWPPVQFGHYARHNRVPYRTAFSISLKRPHNHGTIAASRCQAHRAASEGKRRDGLNMKL